MLDKKMEDAINDQINAELYSAYLYLSVSAYFRCVDLDGAAMWMVAQSQEEQIHAIKLFDHVFTRGGTVKLAPIEGPPSEWDSPLAAFEAALQHEQYITGRINDLVDLATELEDHASASFLQWYVDEQVEEEESVGGVVEKLKLAGEAPGGLAEIDRELGTRSVPPSPFAAPEGE